MMMVMMIMDECGDDGDECGDGDDGEDPSFIEISSALTHPGHPHA